MKINWKLRLQNKTTLAAIISLVVSIIYQVLNACGVIPVIRQQLVLEIAANILTVLGLLGVIVDPTTAGINDSQRAMMYDWPWVDGADTDCVTPAAPKHENG